MPCVYIFQSGNENLFKIGRTRQDIESRHHQLSTGNPHPLTLFDSIETEHESLCEQYLHKVLRTKRHPSGIAREFFNITPSELTVVIEEARQYLATYVPTLVEVDKLREQDAKSILRTPGNEELALYQELLEVCEQQDKLQFRRDYLENRLKIAIGNSEGLDGIATWRNQSTERFDQTRFRNEQPETYKLFLKVTRSRVFRLE